MDGFEVTTEMVATAGEAAGRIADTVVGLDLDTPVGKLVKALPGSRTALVAGRAGPAWAAGVRGLGGQARQHADALGAAAGAYRNADLAGAAGLLTGTTGGTGASGASAAGGAVRRPVRAGSVHAI